MTSKVLIADDSLTIQKVINITLANSGYELVECVKEEDLYRKIQDNKFDLILLDFNLSDSKSGYDLSKMICDKIPQAKVIIMLGTFDAVDESKFAACGIFDKIIKPFESSKLIQKCKDALDGVEAQSFSEEVYALSEEVEVKETVEDELDSWKIDAPESVEDDFQDESTDEIQIFKDEENQLVSEVSGWGFEPGSIEAKFNKTFPDVIEEKKPIDVINKFHVSSEFLEDEISIDLEPAGNLILETPEGPSRISDEILGEIEEEVSADSFWAVDDVVEVESEETESIAKTNLDEITEDLTETVAAFKLSEESNLNSSVTDLASANKTEVSQVVSNINMDELVEKLKVALRPEIEKMLKNEYRALAEKVAWEIIPDLAENLIKKEIREISDSVN